jgi:glycosyltransferase involved in cell wall biosynthesis
MKSLELLNSSMVGETTSRTHVVHRPWQVDSVQEMALLDELGERTVVTNQDLIGYRSPAVFGSTEEWLKYRQGTREALALAAIVLFFSQTAAHDAAAEDLVPLDRSRVVPIGAHAEHLRLSTSPHRPAALTDCTRPFLLTIGNRFRHKNLSVALALLSELRESHDWDGDLVVAGADVLHGSSGGDEAAWRLLNGAHADHVHTLGAIDEHEKAWLLGNAAAVVYPSTYEGFGLVPFEAAAAGTPCLTAHVSALRDSLPEELALLTPWDIGASAARSRAVLDEGAARTGLVEGIRAVGERLTWPAAAAAIVDAYHDALRLPARTTSRLARDLSFAQSQYRLMRETISDVAWALVRPDEDQRDFELAIFLSSALEEPNGRDIILGRMDPPPPPPPPPSLGRRALRRVRRVMRRSSGT